MTSEMQTMCELCESNKATLKCLSCKIGQNLCTNCYKATHHGDSKRSHEVQLFQLSEPVIKSYTQALSMLTMEYYCPIHSKKSLEYVCKLCDCVICCDCLLVGEHKGHDAIGFEEACTAVSEKYKECLVKEQEQQNRLKDIQDAINQKVKKREEKYKIWTETVSSEFNKIIEAVKEKEKTIMQTLDEEKQKEFEKYEKAFEDIKKAQNENKAEIEQLQEAISKKLTPLVYKESKEKVPTTVKEHKIDLVTPFENNKKMNINTEDVLNAVNNLVVLVSASDSLKAPVKKPK